MGHIHDLHAATQDLLDEAADLLGLHDDLRAAVKDLERVVAVQVPYVSDEGRFHQLSGFRVQHSTARGPAKGGIRFHPEVTREEVAGLATLMSVKTALLDLPLGGGKGGVACDPKVLSDREQEQITRSYTRAIAPVIGPNVDIPAPDVNTNEQHMDWLADEYARVAGRAEPAVVTGKSIANGGSLGRDTATAAGCRHTILRAAQHLGLPSEARVVIQGFGNAGGHLAHLLARDGLRIVAVSDSRGAIHNPTGIDVAELLAGKMTTGVVSSYDDADPLDADDITAVDCDILVPAALEGVIGVDEADRVKAALVAEAANGPCTHEGDQVLTDRGIPVIPDVLASAGGVTVSYFEWVQNRERSHWDEAQVSGLLEQHMVSAFDACWSFAEDHRVPLRLAALAIGVRRVAEAIEERARGMGLSA
jgi:glutamate dehydrogenase/leucine dehydrogenase